MRQQNDFADQVEQVEAEKQKYLNQVNEMAFERKEAGKLKPMTNTQAEDDCFFFVGSFSSGVLTSVCVD